MSHRVIQIDSKVSSKAKADSLQTKINNKLDSESYNLHTNDQGVEKRQVNDGVDMKDNATLAVKTDHGDSTEANNFYSWLWNLAQNNQVKYNSDGTVNTHGFTYFRIQIHDCKHLVGLNEPCEIGNANKFDLR